jgi:hypothetical protein
MAFYNANRYIRFHGNWMLQAIRVIVTSCRSYSFSHTEFLLLRLLFPYYLTMVLHLPRLLRGASGADVVVVAEESKDSIIAVGTMPARRLQL